jgi:hypothetical protein
LLILLDEAEETGSKDKEVAAEAETKDIEAASAEEEET